MPRLGSRRLTNGQTLDMLNLAHESAIINGAIVEPGRWVADKQLNPIFEKAGEPVSPTLLAIDDDPDGEDELFIEYDPNIKSIEDLMRLDGWPIDSSPDPSSPSHPGPTSPGPKATTPQQQNAHEATTQEPTSSLPPRNTPSPRVGPSSPPRTATTTTRQPSRSPEPSPKRARCGSVPLWYVQPAACVQTIELTL
ncbi:hypothetical protein KCU92_g9846, partial [Aureobasidium melanogenum]|jgi:hypothetical protein